MRAQKYAFQGKFRRDAGILFECKVKGKPRKKQALTKAMYLAILIGSLFGTQIW